MNIQSILVQILSLPAIQMKSVITTKTKHINNNVNQFFFDKSHPRPLFILIANMLK